MLYRVMQHSLGILLHRCTILLSLGSICGGDRAFHHRIPMIVCELFDSALDVNPHFAHVPSMVTTTSIVEFSLNPWYTSIVFAVCLIYIMFYLHIANVSEFFLLQY